MNFGWAGALVLIPAGIVSCGCQGFQHERVIFKEIRIIRFSDFQISDVQFFGLSDFGLFRFGFFLDRHFSRVVKAMQEKHVKCFSYGLWMARSVLERTVHILETMDIFYFISRLLQQLVHVEHDDFFQARVHCIANTPICTGTLTPYAS
jgi:hypothetical protein